MSPLIPEPACFVLATRADDLEVELQSVAKSFSILSRFAKLNDLKLFCSRQIFDKAVDAPYDRLSPAAVGAAADLVKSIMALLDRHATGRVLDWEGREGIIDKVEPAVEPRPPLYRDPDIDIAWKDLLAQCVDDWTKAPFALVSDQRSFAPTNTSSIRILRSDGEVFKSAAIYSADPSGTGYLSVDAHQTLMSRVPSNPPRPDLDYEDSGHQPGELIKRVLEKTSVRSKGIITRMNTARMVGRGDYCKIRVAASPMGQADRFDQLEWAISDGNMRLRGYFTTLARTPAELQVALDAVRKTYRRECDRVGFRWRD